MKYSCYLIKYAEIGTKGNNRHLFEEALVRRIKNVLRGLEGDYRVIRKIGRIYVEAPENHDSDECIDALLHVFGITWICPVVRVKDPEFEYLKTQVIKYIKDEYGDSAFTFKVESRRAQKNYPVDSQEMNRELGAAILDAFPNLKVDVHKPDALIRVEIREDYANIYSHDIKGPGGMPLGTSGKAMLLLSGGIDSPVAGYMIAKRGVFIDAVYFHAPPYTSERAKEKVVDLAKLVAAYTGPIMLHIVNFTDIQLMIYEKCPHEELTIIMRRYMMRIAEKIALDNDCLGLITGESIGQVASQTLQSLVSTNEVCTLPVYRPLIAFDKQDIVDISEKINTYETSILPYEDCCTIFVAKHPVTKPKAEGIRKSERKLEGFIEPLVEKALETEEKILCERN